MTAKLNYRFRDFSDEYSSVGFEINTVGSANYFDAELGNPVGAAYEIHQALTGISIGTVARYTAKTEDEVVDDVRPVDGNAQRENGLRIYGRDDAGKLHSVTVPCPNKTLLAQPGTDLVDLTGTEMAALVTALESHWTPAGAASITIEKAILVGRAS